MIINQNYILNRASTLITEQQDRRQHFAGSNEKILKIKYGMPAWLRKIIFNPLNPAFAMKKQYDESKGNQLTTPALHRFTIDFMQYIKEHPALHFDCSKYYDKESYDVIAEFIDNRLRSLLAGFSKIPMNQKQKADKQRIDYLRDKAVKKVGKDCFLLKIHDQKYYLPVKEFTSQVFDAHYGLKYLPEYLKRYIANKVFLDIGAYCGDTCLIFSQYNPLQVFAYEPQSENYKLLQKTIAKNKLEKVMPIKKGLGDKRDNLIIKGDGISASFDTAIQPNNTKNELIEITTIDHDCTDKTVGLIKMDVEGFEYFVVKGGINTIKRDKPILLISLYHTGKDFFEIPPILQEACTEYKFKFIDLVPSNVICEKILLAYV